MDPGRRALLVNATELQRRPGTRRHVSTTVAPDVLDIVDDRVAGDVAVSVHLESTLHHVVVTGTLDVAWRDTCRRCLRPLRAPIRVDVDERYADDPAADDDAFPILNGQLDLAPMAREEVLLGLPDAPLCAPDCPGLCPVCGADLQVAPCGCSTAVRDERWAILDQLDLDR